MDFFKKTKQAREILIILDSLVKNRPKKIYDAKNGAEKWWFHVIYHARIRKKSPCLFSTNSEVSPAKIQAPIRTFQHLSNDLAFCCRDFGSQL